MKKKLIALYKTFSGHEWVESSLESIYNHVDKIIMTHSEISWTKDKGNTVKPVVHEWIKHNDTDKKIIEIAHDTNKQDDQYNFAIKMIKESYKDHVVFFIDTDEVWDDAVLLDARHRLEKSDAKAISCKYHVYIKSPLYMVHPNFLGTPTIFLQDKSAYQGVRSNRTQQREIWSDIKFHHFNLVREKDIDIKRKIRRSDFADGFETVDLDEWWVEKWKKLPNCTNFHYTKNFTNLWKSIKIVDDSHFPACVINKKIYRELCKCATL